MNKVSKLFNIMRPIQVNLDIDFGGTINAGGCAVFAYLLAQKLEQNKIPFKWVIYYSGWQSKIQSFSDLYHLLQTNSSNPSNVEDCIAVHVAIKVGNFVIDGKETLSERSSFNKWKTAWRAVKYEFVAPTELFTATVFNSNWNTIYYDYTERRNVLKIQRTLDQYFKYFITL